MDAIRSGEPEKKRRRILVLDSDNSNGDESCKVEEAETPAVIKEATGSELPTKSMEDEENNSEGPQIFTTVVPDSESPSPAMSELVTQEEVEDISHRPLSQVEEELEAMGNGTKMPS